MHQANLNINSNINNQREKDSIILVEEVTLTADVVVLEITNSGKIWLATSLAKLELNNPGHMGMQKTIAREVSTKSKEL